LNNLEILEVAQNMIRDIPVRYARHSPCRNLMHLCNQPASYAQAVLAPPLHPAPGFLQQQAGQDPG
jgi:hypothetical protein